MKLSKRILALMMAAIMALPMMLVVPFSASAYEAASNVDVVYNSKIDFRNSSTYTSETVSKVATITSKDAGAKTIIGQGGDGFVLTTNNSFPDGIKWPYNDLWDGEYLTYNDGNGGVFQSGKDFRISLHMGFRSSEKTDSDPNIVKFNYSDSTPIILRRDGKFSFNGTNVNARDLTTGGDENRREEYTKWYDFQYDYETNTLIYRITADFTDINEQYTFNLSDYGLTLDPGKITNVTVGESGKYTQARFLEWTFYEPTLTAESRSRFTSYTRESKTQSTGIAMQNTSDSSGYVKQNVLYPNGDGFVDCNGTDVRMNDSDGTGVNTKIWTKFFAPSSRMVFLYDGNKDVIKFPVVEEHGKNSNVEVYAINYCTVDNSDWRVDENWRKCVQYNDWDLDTNNTAVDGLTVVSKTEGDYHSNYPASSGQSGLSGNTAFRNMLHYNGSIDSNKIVQTLSRPTFNANFDSVTKWTEWFSTKYGNPCGKGLTGKQLSDGYTVDIKVLNYKPLGDIATAINTNEYKALINDVRNNEWKYTDASLLKFYNFLNRLAGFSINNYDYSSDFGLTFAGEDIQAIVEAYADSTPVKKTFTATFKSAAGATIEARQITAGDALGALPANTAGATHNAGTNTHTVYTWDGIATADTVIQDNAEFTETTKSVACTFEDDYHDATDYMNGYTDQKCSACGNVDYSQRAYDAQDFTTYTEAVDDYHATIGADDYAAKYTADSRADYEAALELAKLTDAQLADETLAPKAIENATAAIIAAKGNLIVASYTVTYVDAAGNETTHGFDYGASAADVEAAAPALTVADYDENGHNTYAWDNDFAVVTGAATYTQVKASTTEHSYTYAHDANSDPSTHTGTCTVGGQTHTSAPVACTFVDGEHVEATNLLNGYTPKVCSVCNFEDESQRVYDERDFSAYNAALTEYTGKADYEELYTADSRADYEAALELAKLTDAQLADETLAPKAIEDATAAIIAAKENLIDYLPDDTYNLTIEDDIKVNFNIDTEYKEAEGGKIVVEYIEMKEDDVSTEPTTEEITSTGAKTTITMQAVPAQIAEPYKFTVKDSEGKTVREFEQSVEDYCIAIINSTDTAVTAKDKELAKSLLAYGAASDAYFSYGETLSKTPNYEVDTTLTDHNDYVENLDFENIKTVDGAHAKLIKSGNDASGNAITVTSISYVALIEPEFRFYVNQTNQVYAAMTDVSIAFEDPTVTGVEAKMVHTPNGNCVRVTGLKASEFGKVFTLTIGGTELEYNGYAFLYTVLRDANKTNPTPLQALAIGVYRYAAASADKFNA